MEARQERGGEDAGFRPQLEFVFRTLVDLRVDMDELRRDFEVYRRSLGPGGVVAAGLERSLAWESESVRREGEGPPAQDAEIVDVSASSGAGSGSAGEGGGCAAGTT